MYSTKVLQIRYINRSYYLQLIRGFENPYWIQSKSIVNSAGLDSDCVAKLLDQDRKYSIHYCKGAYYNYKGNARVSKLVYPVPQRDLKGLGIHLTLSIDGNLMFGPDAVYMNVREKDYSVDHLDSDEYKQKFCDAIRRYMPSIRNEELIPGYVGIRPKLSTTGFSDFSIVEESERGFPGFVNLVGIESPGLTSSLAIAKYVSNLL